MYTETIAREWKPRRAEWERQYSAGWAACLNRDGFIGGTLPFERGYFAAMLKMADDQPPVQKESEA